MSSAKDFETLSVGGTAVGFTSSKTNPTGARPMTKVVVTVDSGNVRVRWDGTSPTASVGHLFAQGGGFMLTGIPNLTACKFISEDGATASVSVTYERGLGDY